MDMVVGFLDCELNLGPRFKTTTYMFTLRSYIEKRMLLEFILHSTLLTNKYNVLIFKSTPNYYIVLVFVSLYVHLGIGHSLNIVSR